MKKVVYLFVLASLLFFTQSCNDKSNKKNLIVKKEVTGSGGALVNWGKNIIVPAYKNYQKEVRFLVADAQKFQKNRTEENLQNLKESWLNAYKSFQKVLIFNFGYAESTYLVEMANTYPTYPQKQPESVTELVAIEDNIALILAGKKDEISLEPTYAMAQQVYQGFPALDYLLFEKEHSLAYYKSAKGDATATYIVLLTEFLQKNIDAVVEHWENYLPTYIADEDLSSNGAYASTINGFLKAYEKSIRSDKVAYATGAINIQGGKAEPTCIEGYYRGTVSKELLKIALESSQDFFNGKHFKGTEKGKSIYSLLVDLKHKKLADAINKQYEEIYKVIDSMPKSLKETAISDKEKMEELYLALQRNVAYYKIDMLAALNIELGYQDTDGD
ncbi:MAG: imelysin family protein [Flavobacteriaceae bacterium]|nr:imelysin family protein [Flavobacteriaceae bacterium]